MTLRESVAELVSRISHLREANARLEARLKLVREEMEKVKERHDKYRELVFNLREDKQTSQSNWAFRSMEDFHLKANAAIAVEQLLGELGVAQKDLERERVMFDWLADHLKDVCVEDNGVEIDPLMHMDEETVVTAPQAWRVAITKYLDRKEPDEHQRPS